MRLPPPSSGKPHPSITEETRARVLQLANENPRWNEKQIAAKLKGTTHEIADWAVAMVLVTRNYRDK